MLTAVLGALLLLAGAARPAAATPCEDCFAVFVMPDTQMYTQALWQPQGAAHLDLITRWICANRSFVEPSTGKTMPIAMVIQLGDLVQSGDFDETGNGPLDQWQRVDVAFDNLDACAGGAIPYAVVTGNHDYKTKDQYETVTEGYNTFFGTDRWAAYQCASPLACSGEPGDWFIGGGDLILANSRNLVGEPSGPGPPPPPPEPGPSVDQPGRHRAAVVKLPSGGRMLFLGLEMAFDFTTPSDGDLAWVDQVMSAYPGVPAIAFHHTLLGPQGQFVGDRIASFQSDSFDSTQEVFDAAVAPYASIFMTFNGHWTGYVNEQGQVVNSREAEGTAQNLAGLDVQLIFRNYQAAKARDATGSECGQNTGGGWNNIAVFDPEDGEIRLRSYRIDDTDEDCTHDGTPASPATLDKDLFSSELVMPWSFPDTLPTSLDNCPNTPNPDQADADGDGIGDACEAACEDGLDNDADAAIDYPQDVGCKEPSSVQEAPPCQDGINNDPGEDALIDFDGGASAGLPAGQQTEPDPQCNNPWAAEHQRRCGLGFELAVVAGALWSWRARRASG